MQYKIINNEELYGTDQAAPLREICQKPINTDKQGKPNLLESLDGRALTDNLNKPAVIHTVADRIVNNGNIRVADIAREIKQALQSIFSSEKSSRITLTMRNGEIIDAEQEAAQTKINVFNIISVESDDWRTLVRNCRLLSRTQATSKFSFIIPARQTISIASPNE
jgi:hypothetical protein